MAAKPKHREMLRSFAIGDTDNARRLNDEMPDAEREDYHTLVSALFAVLLERQFKDNLSRDAISGFVTEMTHDYRNSPHPIKPLTIEGVIRGAFGDEHLLDDVSSEEILSAQYQVIGKIAAQSGNVSSDIDSYLDRAEALVTEWESEEA